MKRFMLKSKIHRARVIDSNLHYEGSISIDKELMKKANLYPFEKVEIYNITNGSRPSTYVIESNEPGMIRVNGALARLILPDDLIIICSYVTSFFKIKPKLVYVDKDNKITKVNNKIVKDKRILCERCLLKSGCEILKMSSNFSMVNDVSVNISKCKKFINIVV